MKYFKKLILTFALVLTVSFAFAGNETEKISVVDVEEISTLNQPSEAINLESKVFASCTITIKNNKTGDSYTITIHGKSCSDLLKEMM